MPGRIHLAEHERLSHITREQAEILATEIDTAVSQTAPALQHRVAHGLMRDLILAHSQLLTQALVEAARRRSGATGALAQLVTTRPATAGPLVLPAARRN